ncbi:MAG: tRNA epoxyqueuosine(34) reductase QueG [Turicibacter sp.]|nr:tRNA epoxyqueuosine(34) reductase QueG [Turicibacter sp.]
MSKSQVLKERLIQYSKEIGVDIIGFSEAKPFLILEAELQRRETLGWNSGLAKGGIDERTNPLLSMANAKSFISIGMAYPRVTVLPKQDKDDPFVQFSRSSWGIDYHELVGEKLNLLEEWLREAIPDIDVIRSVDTGVFNDRAVALRCGIGFSGKNSSIINETFGSYIYLGELLVSYEFPSDIAIESKCGTCDRCVRACPTKAIQAEGGLNEKRCLSYVTQAKEYLDKELYEKISQNVYGCDICQEVCPFNKGVDFHLHPEMEPTGIEFPKISELFQMTNKDFKLKYGHLAGSWRGISVLKRNAMFNAGFYKYKTALPEIAKIRDGQGPDWLKEAAKQAYNRLEKK